MDLQTFLNFLTQNPISSSISGGLAYDGLKIFGKFIYEKVVKNGLIFKFGNKDEKTGLKVLYVLCFFYFY